MKRTDNPLNAIKANVAMCNKLLRVFYAMIMHDEDYDEKKMLGDIRRMDKTKESSAAVEAGKLKNELDMILEGAKGQVLTDGLIEQIRSVGKGMKGLVAVAERGSVKEAVSRAAGG